MKKLYERLEDATLRMECVVLLAGMLNDGSAMADPLRELLEDEDDDTLRQCFPDMPAALLADRDDEDLFRESFCEWANDTGKWGFAVQFARPVMDWNSKGDISVFSWGHYNTAWLYGDTLAQAVALGVKWAREREAAEKARADAAAAIRGDRPSTPVGWSDTDWLAHLEQLPQKAEAAYAKGPLPERGWD